MNMDKQQLAQEWEAFEGTWSEFLEAKGLQYNKVEAKYYPAESTAARNHRYRQRWKAKKAQFCCTV